MTAQNQPFDWSILTKAGNALSNIGPIAQPQNDMMGKVFALNPIFGQALYGARTDQARTGQNERALALQEMVMQKDIQRQDALKRIAESYSSGGSIDDFITKAAIETGDLGSLVELATQREKLNAEKRRSDALRNFLGLGTPLAQGSPVQGSVSPSSPLNVRQNNPGNLRPVGQAEGFQSFQSPQEGLDAMRKDLAVKISGNSGAMKARFGEGYAPTLANLITTWAPPEENNTANYIDFVSKKTGINPNDVLSPMQIDKIMPAMIEMEGGKGAVDYFAQQPQNTAQPAQPQNQALQQMAALAAFDPEQYGDDYIKAQMEYAKSEKEAIEKKEKSVVEEKKALTEGERDLRKEFEGLPDVKLFRETEGAYKRVLKAVDDPSAAGDIALIFNFMKMLDPASVVRETEFATAQNAAGVPEIIRNQWNKLQSGERLNPVQRQDFINQAKGQYIGAEELFTVRANQYKGLASEYGFKPERIVTGARQVVDKNDKTPTTQKTTTPNKTVTRLKFNPATGDFEE